MFFFFFEIKTFKFSSNHVSNVTSMYVHVTGNKPFDRYHETCARSRFEKPKVRPHIVIAAPYVLITTRSVLLAWRVFVRKYFLRTWATGKRAGGNVLHDQYNSTPRVPYDLWNASSNRPARRSKCSQTFLNITGEFHGRTVVFFEHTVTLISEHVSRTPLFCRIRTWPVQWDSRLNSGNRFGVLNELCGLMSFSPTVKNPNEFARIIDVRTVLVKCFIINEKKNLNP